MLRTFILSCVTSNRTKFDVLDSAPAKRPAPPTFASGFGVEVDTIVDFTNQPRSGLLPSPWAMRKSFRMYWFSLKTPLRDGLSATHPQRTHEPLSAIKARDARLKFENMDF